MSLENVPGSEVEHRGCPKTSRYRGSVGIRTKMSQWKVEWE